MSSFHLIKLLLSSVTMYFLCKYSSVCMCALHILRLFENKFVNLITFWKLTQHTKIDMSRIWITKGKDTDCFFSLFFKGGGRGLFYSNWNAVGVHLYSWVSIVFIYTQFLLISLQPDCIFMTLYCFVFCVSCQAIRHDKYTCGSPLP